MPWEVLVDDALTEELLTLERRVRIELLAHARLLGEFGPGLGRPYVDTLKMSRHANMKELRFNAGDGVWRVAFAFDLKRRAVLLVAADKAGTSQRRFYKKLIAGADKRLDAHLAKIRKQEGKT